MLDPNSWICAIHQPYQAALVPWINITFILCTQSYPLNMSHFFYWNDCITRQVHCKKNLWRIHMLLNLYERIYHTGLCPRWYVFPSIILQSSRLSWSVVIPLSVPCVPTGINTGKSTSQWGNTILQQRALLTEHSATTCKLSACLLRRLVIILVHI